MKHLEFRLWMQHRAPNGMSDGDMANVGRVAADLVLLISPRFHRGSLVRFDDPAYAEHCGPFRERSYDLAEALGAKIVVLFPPLCASYDQWYDWLAHVVDDMREAAEAAGKRGLMLALENEPACYAGSGQSLAKLVAEINHPHLRANWDAGNHTNATGEDFRAGYAALKPWHVHTHVKHYVPERAMAIPPGEGGVDWPGQLRALGTTATRACSAGKHTLRRRSPRSRSCYQGLCRMLAAIGEEAE